jgi:hypothetical protein
LHAAPATCFVHSHWFKFCELHTLIDKISVDHAVFVKFFDFFCTAFKMSKQEMQDYLVYNCGYDFLGSEAKTGCKTLKELISVVGKEKAFLAVSEKNPAVASFFVKLATGLQILLERYNWACYKDMDGNTINWSLEQYSVFADDNVDPRF